MPFQVTSWQPAPDLSVPTLSERNRAAGDLESECSPPGIGGVNQVARSIKRVEMLCIHILCLLVHSQI